MVYFEKAFDRVDWVRMVKILKDIGADWKVRRFIVDLYMKQEIMVRLKGGCSNATMIGRGVRQGCLMSPLLFWLYAEAMKKESMNGNELRRCVV